MALLEYQIDATRPGSHCLAITLVFDAGALAQTSGEGECLLFLPTWTPGSYLIREFSRHLSRVLAADATTDRAIACRKVAKNRFALQLQPGQRSVRVSYTVYARELSVRTADVTSEHAYWNHACLLLWPVGSPNIDARLRVIHPPDWRLACSLPTSVEAPGVTTLLARDLDQVLDSPCLVGTFVRFDWEVKGVPHAVVLDGLGPIKPPTTLVDDLDRVVAQAAAVFGGQLPYSEYLFLCLFTAEGHGGLEHASSTTLLMARTALASPARYRDFLALAAHELFHAWNVKRMRPVEFWRYDYEHENYSELLWLIEGWTAYYDDLLCHRAGLMTQAEYLAIVAKNVNTMLSGQGRHHSSLAESSFDAWIRLYRPDENTRNSSQNYYGNGAVVAMCLDLSIQRETDGRASLDDVVRGLYATTFEQGRGYTRDDVTRVVADVAGDMIAATMNLLVGDCVEPDLANLFADFGLRMGIGDSDKAYLGITFASGSTSVASVALASPAHQAGISPGDELVAIANLRVDSGNWQEVFAAVSNVAKPVDVLVARRGVMMTIAATPDRSPGSVSFEEDAAASPQQLQRRRGWLTPPVAHAPASEPPSPPPSELRV